MKYIYTLLTTILLSTSISAQGYEFGIMHNGGYSFTIVATPDFDAVDTDISDIGFTLMLPTGNADIVNTDQFSGRAWSSTEVTASQLDGLNLGDGTRDGFIMNLPPGQTEFSHANGVAFPLVSFEVINMPTAGELELLPNTDPIAQGLGGVLDSFFNSNIDNTTTQNYFSGFTLGMESFGFSTLSVDEVSSLEPTIRIYPNPASEIVTIVTSNTIDRVEVFDIQGKQVKALKQTNTIDVSDLNSGMYIVRIKTDNSTITKRLVKK